MKSIFTRRRFLGSAAMLATSASLTSAVHLDSTLLRRSATQAPQGPVPPSVFVRGIVAAKNPREFILRIGNDSMRVQAPEGIPVFRNGFVNVAHICEGDDVAIAGAPITQGAIEARRIWVNLPAHLLGWRW